MAPKARVVTIRLEADMAAALDEIRTRVGVPLSEQVRRALQAWLEQRQEPSSTKAARKRGATRRRA